ncbi:MAG: MFS transporter, partial [Oscillospiraceae bacterium]|nr:MFS transporter [Oscillospiraceae bacterium]
MKNKRPFSPGVLIFLIYLIYIVLGMSGALMGAAWPSMYGGLGVPDSWLGILSVIISTGMVVTGVLLGRAIKRFGTGAIVVFCSAVSAVGSFGFAISPSFAVMCVLCAVVGFGGGFLDPVINSYVAVNYEARHMNLMHLSWGVGSMIGPFIVSFGITKTSGWRFSYLAVGGVQTVLLILIILTVALWGGVAANNESSKAEPPKETSAKLSKILRLPGIFWALASFFLYSAVEYVVALWGSSYLVHAKSLPPETAAWMLSLYFLGMTAGRGGSAFLSSK